MTAPLHIRGIAPSLALDFVNTRLWRGREQPVETLGGAPDLVDFLGRIGCHDAGAIAAGRAWAETHAETAKAAFDRAIKAREAACRAFTALAERLMPATEDVEALDHALVSLPPRARVALGSGGLAWVAEVEPTLFTLLAPVLWAAADLLTARDHSRLRRCANDECLWLFLDESRMGNRRWCDMTSCGNRAKARRHYARVKSGG
jgi:predicted RNA-binding Zn ribbon-like protein